jgi:hypothetical protein
MVLKSTNNALIHGVYASDIILPWESEDEFKELWDGIRSELKPQGTIEEEIVYDMAVIRWRRHRANRSVQLAVHQTPFAQEVEKSGKKSLGSIRRHLSRLLREKQRVKREFEAALATLSEAVTDIGKQAAKQKKYSGRSANKLKAQLQALEQEIGALRPVVERVEKMDDAEKMFESAHNLEVIGRAVEIESRLDSQLDKLVKSLVMVREFKRQYSSTGDAKLIEHKAHEVSVKAPKWTSMKSGRQWPTKKDQSHGGENNDNNDNLNINDNANEEHYKSDDND